MTSILSFDTADVSQPARATSEGQTHSEHRPRDTLIKLFDRFCCTRVARPDLDPGENLQGVQTT